MFFSTKTFFEVMTAVFVNLTSGWFGVLFVAPGLFEVVSFFEYRQLLTINLPFGILGLGLSLWLTEKNKSL